ncbi:hypothetical protein ABID49_001380 [Bhargavaea ullalensis]|uniref:Uncharacterized protein n=1 Tax=Bhargavaea ullalensis TaxID=1265685 RepID=A0ABV2GB12_9BACL
MGHHSSVLEESVPLGADSVSLAGKSDSLGEDSVSLARQSVPLADFHFFNGQYPHCISPGTSFE